MSESGRTVGPGLVVLPGRVWLEELTGELMASGMEPDEAGTSATAMLQHICARAGWPREVFQVATETRAVDANVRRLAANRPEGR